MKKLNRREFIKKASLTALGSSALLSACASEDKSGAAPAINLNKTSEWKMVTTWPPGFPVLGEGAVKMAGWIDTMSAGRLKIKVYGAGELVPALEAFEAVQQGIADMAHGAAYYWAGKMPASQFFAAVPFGMNAQQMNAWVYGGEGLQLWEELYGQFGMIPMPCGNTGVQMGGWFNRRIDSIDDIKGLKMRIPGLGGKVIEKAGGTAVLLAGGEIFPSLERKVIDATEWIGPYHDYKMGFHKIARYYYYPGWHEPGTILEGFINRNSFNALPADLQEIVRTAAYRANLWMLSEFEAKNSFYLQKIRNESKAEILRFPDEVLARLRTYSRETIEEITAGDAMSKKVYASFSKFQRDSAEWSDLTEKAYFEMLKE